MKLLMFSVDPKILEEGTASRSRAIAYSSIVDELAIILYTRAGFHVEKLSPKVTVYPTNSSSRFSYFLDAYRIGKKLISKNTLITSQDGVTNFVAVFLSYFYKVPLQVQIHTDFMSPYFLRGSWKNLFHYIGYRLGIAYASGIRVVSERTKRSIYEAGFRIKQEPVVLPIFVETKPLRASAVVFDLHRLYPQFEKIILVASRLTKEKNIALAIDAFAGIFGDFSRVGLVIVGEGEERGELERLVLKHALRSHIILEPWQERTRLLSYYQTADLFLLTSNYEGYGMSLVEAAVAGCPIVTTPVGLVGDTLTSDNVLITEIGDEGSLESTLRFALTHPEEIKKMAERARKQVSANASFGTMDEYLKSYQKALEKSFKRI